MPLRKDDVEGLMRRLERQNGKPIARPIGGADTLTFLLRKDSAFVLISGRRYPMDSTTDKHVRYLLFVARREAANPITKPITVH